MDDRPTAKQALCDPWLLSGAASSNLCAAMERPPACTWGVSFVQNAAWFPRTSTEWRFCAKPPCLLVKMMFFCIFFPVSLFIEPQRWGSYICSYYKIGNHIHIYIYTRTYIYTYIHIYIYTVTCVLALGNQAFAISLVSSMRSPKIALSNKAIRYNKVRSEEDMEVRQPAASSTGRAC